MSHLSNRSPSGIGPHAVGPHVIATPAAPRVARTAADQKFGQEAQKLWKINSPITRCYCLSCKQRKTIDIIVISISMRKTVFSGVKFISVNCCIILHKLHTSRCLHHHSMMCDKKYTLLDINISCNKQLLVSCSFQIWRPLCGIRKSVNTCNHQRRFDCHRLSNKTIFSHSFSGLRRTSYDYDTIRYNELPIIRYIDPILLWLSVYVLSLSPVVFSNSTDRWRHSGHFKSGSVPTAATSRQRSSASADCIFVSFFLSVTSSSSCINWTTNCIDPTAAAAAFNPFWLPADPKIVYAKFLHWSSDVPSIARNSYQYIHASRLSYRYWTLADPRQVNKILHYFSYCLHLPLIL